MKKMCMIMSGDVREMRVAMHRVRWVYGYGKNH